jgi:hypothetical protein
MEKAEGAGDDKLSERIDTADTNIYISALNFGGLPRQFFRLAIQGHFELAVSPKLQVEIERVLRQRFSWTREAV